MKLKSCQIRDSQWIDYLEHNLDAQTVDELDAHLLSCAQCRESLELQQKWLQVQARYLEPDKVAQSLNATELADLNSRIMQAVRLEAAKTATKGTNKAPFWRQRSFWYQSAGAAAMIVLLMISIQLVLQIPALAGRTMKTTAMIDFIAGDQENSTKVDALGQGEMTQAESPTTTTAQMAPEMASGWRIYSGSFNDLPAARIFFDEADVKSVDATDYGTREVQESSAEATTAAMTEDGGTVDETTAGESTTYPGTESEVTTVDRMELLVNSFNARGKSMYDILTSADSVRVLTDESDAGQILILAAFADKSIGENESSIREALEGCQSSIKIEIIKAERLPDFLNGFESGLYDKVFETSGSSGQSWISILIGA